MAKLVSMTGAKNILLYKLLLAKVCLSNCGAVRPDWRSTATGTEDGEFRHRPAAYVGK